MKRKDLKGEKWIAGAVGKPGALHAQLGVPPDEEIPDGELKKAAKAKGKLGKRARLAITLGQLRAGKKGG
jgi:hypothetical protein